MEKLYVIINNDGGVFGEKVYTDKEYANYIVEQTTYEYEYGWEYPRLYVKEVQMPFIGRNIYYVLLYRGFDYDFGNTNGKGIFDVTNKMSVNFYNCLSDVKSKDKVWLNSMKWAEEKPEEHHVYENKICSDDYGTDWDYGDIMEGKFSTSIEKMRVCKIQL